MVAVSGFGDKMDHGWFEPEDFVGNGGWAEGGTETEDNTGRNTGGMPIVGWNKELSRWLRWAALEAGGFVDTSSGSW